MKEYKPKLSKIQVFNTVLVGHFRLQLVQNSHQALQKLLFGHSVLGLVLELVQELFCGHGSSL